MRFQEWFATSPVASWLRSFLAIVIAMFLADGADVFAVDAGDLRAWAAAGLAATLPVVVRALNPSDFEFGVGSFKADRFDVFGDDEETDNA